MSKQSTPSFMLLGDVPLVQPIWPEEPFRWEFDDWDRWQPPGFKLVNNGIENVWAIKIDGSYCHPDSGDIIVYGKNCQPLRIESKGLTP